MSQWTNERPASLEVRRSPGASCSSVSRALTYVRFPHLAVVGEGTGKIRSIALKSEAGLGAAGLW